MTAGRRFSRLLFFTTETGTLASWFIFTGSNVEIFYRGILIDRFKPLLALAVLSLIVLPIVSFHLKKSDSRLAHVGFATFFGVLGLTAVFQLL